MRTGAAVVALIAIWTVTSCGSAETIGSATTGTAAPTRTIEGSTPTTAGMTSSITSEPMATLPATTSPLVSPPANTGAYGYVTAGPTCPVERAEQPCPPRPVTAQIEARDSAGSLVATGPTDAAGRFSLSLRPGYYTLTVSTGAIYPRCPTVDVAVADGVPTRADISCDTGIR
ncbi:MAG: hypothetical protein ABJD24_05040 [Acidimicrobiales bacterium]